ncbi:L-threonylcarbamoyladenylate synthase [Paenibacillus endoradicis]|uniref:L-threonylcarbamoyladenylate synthase n=1 Tax=Paenibacillus endoradicis TaxID=2972487 RepID=UPI0021597C61|nr:L-threonylcarbamoyladenylate synthase [Paenibacillus endoradicis]MCR8660445.1 L-threonylcarbamoyladenylate synthase [Paenibacillus endoradicis]
MNNTTHIWKINIQQSGWQQQLEAAALALQQGEQVAFPTETVYGLGADATSSSAVQGIFTAKGRPSDNPLIVHISNKQQLDGLVERYDGLAEQLMERFWPGPLTIVLPVKEGVLSPYVTAGLATVGIRMPNHPLALELINQANCPIAAPSANRSGRPSPTLAEHVYEDLADQIAGIVDGGATGVGLESTVVEIASQSTIRVLRPGGVTEDDLRQCCPQATILTETELQSKEAPRSPGMKYTHYAPKGQLVVVKGEDANVTAYIVEQLEQYQASERCAVLAFAEHIDDYHYAEHVISMGSMHNLEEAAASLYAALRNFDERGITRIWSEASGYDGIGAALMNRLHKAAGHDIVHV